MITNNVSHNFNVTAFAKLVTMIAVVEKLQPGAINFIVQTAAFLADDWDVNRRVNNIDAAQRLFVEFEAWLYEADNQPQEPSDGSYAI